MKALDDISYTNGECPHISDCNFENDNTCEWEVAELSDSVNVEWIVVTGNSNFGIF